jgi:hypothetical protein
MANKSTLSDYLAELGVDINNMQEFLNKLSQMLTTSSDTVAINQTLQDGTPKTFNVPSFAYLKNKIDSIDDKFNSLLTGNANQVGVMDENGQLRRFELQDISQVVADLDSVAGKTVPNPLTFNYKTNWFFESFLNPLIYVDIPVESIATSDVDKFEVKRVIMTSQAIEDTTYFDATYKGQNNIVYSNLLADLNARAINTFEDSNEVLLPPSQNKRSGSFNILDILSDVQSEVIGAETLTFTITKYVLNTLRYTEKSASSPNGLVQRTLKVGDYLITQDNSEYEITAVNTAQKSVVLNRVFGIGSLALGANELTIKPQLDPVTTLSINVGYNERQVIFLRPISTRLRISTDNLSQGIGIYSNELTISLGNGENMNMSDFYKQFVSDFGLLFLSYAKERKLPASLGDIPSAPVLETGSFTVIQSDEHIRESDDILQVKKNISSIEQVKSQIREVDKQISDKRSELNINATLSEAQKLKLSKDLASLSDNRKTLTTQQSSKISSVTTAVKSVPTLTAAPVYRVKGFWHIPDPKVTENGIQNVVQFKIAYRVLSKTGTSEKVEQITFTDPAGNKVVGAFSPWKESLSIVRKKNFNTTTGFYEWAPEKISDPDSVNINQVEIPISKGQVVEIKVKSLSEAGFPDNPIESDWSNSVLIEFPANLQSLEDISVISQQAFAEEAKINFQDELNSKGLDLHLGTSFTTRDKYFAHKTDDIASGFFSTDGSVVDLYTKLKSISDTLTSVQTAIASGAGQLKVSIIDQDGNQIEVSNGQTVNIFAGYYKDQIKNASGKSIQYEHGKIISKQYSIQIENTSQTALELISSIIGGTAEAAPTSNPGATSIYDTSLRYDITPITINNPSPGVVAGLQQAEGLQSSQVKGQILYQRAKTLNLSDALVVAEPIENVGATGVPPDPNGDFIFRNLDESYDYDYSGFIANRDKVGYESTVPYTAGHYLPYKPTLKTLAIKTFGIEKDLTINENVWSGSFSGDRSPAGGGLLSEFCISIDHPDIKKNGKYNLAWAPALYRPRPANLNQASGQSVTLAGYTVAPSVLKKLPFSHAAHFEIGQADMVNALGAKYFQQAVYRKPSIPSLDSGQTTPSQSVMRESHFPIKTSFDINDKYLIGKYTCGAYLNISPYTYANIAATSISPNGAKRIIPYGTTTAIKIPLIFQYRCSDYLKYVGGFRADSPSGLKNISYVKKIGIDIGLKDELFSFDVEVRAQYEKETSVITPATGISQTSTVGTAALTA